jgi:hypothetical protein
VKVALSFSVAEATEIIRKHVMREYPNTLEIKSISFNCGKQYDYYDHETGVGLNDVLVTCEEKQLKEVSQ